MGSLDGWSSARSFRKSAAAVKATTNRAECVSGAPLRHSSARAMSSIAIASPIASVDARPAYAPNGPPPIESGKACSAARISTPASAAGNETPASANPAPNTAAASAAAVSARRGGHTNAPAGRQESESTCIASSRQSSELGTNVVELVIVKTRPVPARGAVQESRCPGTYWSRRGWPASRCRWPGLPSAEQSPPAGFLEIAARTSTVSCG